MITDWDLDIMPRTQISDHADQRPSQEIRKREDRITQHANKYSLHVNSIY